MPPTRVAALQSLKRLIARNFTITTERLRGGGRAIRPLTASIGNKYTRQSFDRVCLSPVILRKATPTSRLNAVSSTQRLQHKSVSTVFRFFLFVFLTLFCLRACMHLSPSLSLSSSSVCVSLCVFDGSPSLSALSPSLLLSPPFFSPSFCRYPHRTWDRQEAKDNANGQCRCQLAGLKRAKGKANALRPFPHSSNHRFKHSPLKITPTRSLL